MRSRGARTTEIGSLALIMLAAASACFPIRGKPSDAVVTQSYLSFRNETEDEVRVFAYEGDRPWFLGNVQAFRAVRLRLPADLPTHRGELVYLAAVPIGGRGRDGSPATGAMIRSDTELADNVTAFRWTLLGHTLSAAPGTSPRR